MKIEKLNENKIKITFNIDDLAEKNIDLYSFMHNAPETQELFWDILNEAEKECGFNVDNSMICVEALTSGAGNFTLIVTKTNEKPILNANFNSSYKQKKLKLKRKNISLNSTQNIYQFNSFDDLCDFVKTVDLRKIKDNILYSMKERYYLETSNMPFNNILEYASISRYPFLLEGQLKEYGKVLINQNALQTISKYFIKTKKRT